MAGIEAISAFIPGITSGTIFAPRRANKGAESDNALVAAMNFGIAGGQIGNVFRGVASIAKASTGEVAEKIIKLDNAIGDVTSKLSKTDKLMNGAIKGGYFVMRNINPAIGATELVKAMFAEDKLDASLTGGCAFGAMLLGEGAAKRIMGLPKTSYNKGVCNVTQRTPMCKIFENSYMEKQVRALCDYLNIKNIVSEKVIKHAPSVTKGLLFAATSIGSYILGRTAGKFISENVHDTKKEQKKEYKPAA